MPSFSWSSVASGQYFRQLDDYISDNFIGRYTLTELAGEVRSLRGWNPDEVQIFSGTQKKPQATAVASVVKHSVNDSSTTDSAASQLPILKVAGQEGLGVAAADTVRGEVAHQALTPAAPVTQPAQEQVPAPATQPVQVPVPVVQAPAPAAVAQPVQATAPAPSTQTAQAPTAAPQSVKGNTVAPAAQSSEDLYENVESIIIYRGRALQMFGGPPQMTQSLAKAINRYREELSSEINIFFMAIPIGSDFYLPRKVNNGVMREKLAIDHIQTLLDPGVKFVSAYDRLAEHTDEYIHFNTDHHWTGLGGYYAYTAFAQAAGFSALPLSELVKGEIPNFLGTLYQRTMAPSLRSKIDTVEYFKVPVKTDASYYPANSSTPVPLSLYAEYARGGNAYGVFLGGDFPLMRVVSDVKNSQKIAVIKDSYGNAFVPYLASHYEEVYILDYRYFVGNIKTLLEDNGIQNLLFAHNTYVMMGSYTAQRAIGFLTAAPGATPKIIDK